ncbi:RNA polymerase sigma factor [Pedobacter sp.]|uniref:RNA polymerase sigma factor n=1 Tax=Pedobacter sp. TaxID=1411316 RepID=UPI003C4F2C1B
MKDAELIPHLFRTEYRKIVSVLCYLFGIEHIETAEDIVSETFLVASETWSVKGIPEKPAAWLYTVAKNKTRNFLKRNAIFEQKLIEQARLGHGGDYEEINVDLSEKNINDSQLAMMFTVCVPSISKESQISLALNLLCGFGVQEIADGFLTGKDTIYKRIKRAKEKLKSDGIKIEPPRISEINQRLETVLTAIYLLFSEGYYSVSNDITLRKDVCAEAMRLNHLLIENKNTDVPASNALLSLMYFHASRFDARTDELGSAILYEDQDENRWNRQLITQGIYYLNRASKGEKLTKYHLEAGIAYWHTHKKDTSEKWENILELYNKLIILEYSPIVAMNRTFAVAKVMGKEKAITEAEKLRLVDNHLYFSLLGNLYTDIDNNKALAYFQTAKSLATTTADKTMIAQSIRKINI